MWDSWGISDPIALVCVPSFGMIGTGWVGDVKRMVSGIAERLLEGPARWVRHGGCVQLWGLLGKSSAPTKRGYLLFTGAVSAVPHAVTVSAVISLFALASHARENCKVVFL